MADLTANEGGSKVVTAVFTDEDGADVVPNSVNWTLVNEAGSVINSRENVVVSVAQSVSIVLSGDDLPWYGAKITDTYPIYVSFNVEYDSVLESDVPLVEEQKINVRNIIGTS